MLICLTSMMAYAVSGNSLKGRSHNSIVHISGGYMTEMFISFGVPHNYSMIPTMGVYIFALVLSVFVRSGL